MSSLLIEVNGVEYKNFKSASVMSNLDAIADTFEFDATVTKINPLPFTLNDECKISADGVTVLTGFIEGINVTYNSRTHTVNIFGRSKTADLVDSNIDKLELKAPITLKEVIEKVISHIGADISVIDNVGSIESFKKAEDLLSPEVGENAFEFIEKTARKRQVLLTSNGDGNVVMTNAGSDSAPQALQNIIGAENNNIESGAVSYDNTEQFNKYIVKSQLNPTTTSFAGDTNNKSIVGQKSESTINSEIRSSRQLVIQAENASSDKECEKRAKWESNIRGSRSVIYSTTLPNFSHNGNLWKVNQVTSIKDDFVRISMKMLVNTVEYISESDNTQLILSFVDEDSYKPDPIPPKTGKVKGDWTESYR